MLVDAARIVAAAQRRASPACAPVPDHWRAPGLAAAASPPRRSAAARAGGEARRPPTAAGRGGRDRITMPFGDLTVSEGTVVAWLKAVGDAVKAGELVAEIETDKAVVEIEAPVSRDARGDRRSRSAPSCRWAAASGGLLRGERRARCAS